MRGLLGAANRRYLEFLSALDDPSAGIPHMQKIAKLAREGERTHRGINLLDAEDLGLLRAICRGEFAISGFTARMLRKVLAEPSAGRVSRLLKRPRSHGVIKKIGLRYKYYLTEFGRRRHKRP